MSMVTTWYRPSYGIWIICIYNTVYVTISGNNVYSSWTDPRNDFTDRWPMTDLIAVCYVKWRIICLE